MPRWQHCKTEAWSALLKHEDRTRHLHSILNTATTSSRQEKYADAFEPAAPTRGPVSQFTKN